MTITAEEQRMLRELAEGIDRGEVVSTLREYSFALITDLEKDFGIAGVPDFHEACIGLLTGASPYDRDPIIVVPVPIPQEGQTRIEIAEKALAVAFWHLARILSVSPRTSDEFVSRRIGEA